MTSQGPYTAGTVANNSSGPTGGTGGFSNPADAEGTGTSPFATWLGNSAHSTYLQFTGWNGGAGFAIPSGATINGIVVTITGVSNFSSSKEAIEDYVVSLVVGGSVVGNNKAAAGDWSTSNQTVTYGSSTDPWGLTPTVSQINSATQFGVALSVQEAGSSGTATPTATVISCTAQVYYTASGGAPDAPTALGVNADATNPTTSLDLAWTGSSTGSPTGYVIQQASTLAGTFSTVVSNTGSGATTYTITGLTPGTEYAFQVAGINGSGTGSYSTPAAFATAAAGPTPSIGTVTASTIALSWTAPTVGSTITILQYAVYYRVTGAGSFTSFGTTSGTSLTVTGLSPSTSYDFEITTTIESNNSDWSGVIAGPAGTVVTHSTLVVDVPIPLGPAGFMGTGACPFGVTNQMRRNRVEGVRFQHK